MTFDNTFVAHPDSAERPYRLALWPIWRTGTPLLACDSASALYEKYVQYKAAGDFLGMDMARKFILMGYARSRNSAKKRGKSDLCARVFFRVLIWVMRDADYKRMRAANRALVANATRVAPTDAWVEWVQP